MNKRSLSTTRKLFLRLPIVLGSEGLHAQPPLGDQLVTIGI